MGVQHVFLSTLTPQKEPFTQFGYPRRNVAMPFLEAANAEIRALAAREGVYLVDAYAAMIGRASTLVGGDGLHMTQEGFVVLAETFFAVIREKLELPPGSAIPASAGSLFLRSNVEIRAQPPRQPVRIR
jgi:lysophospholipase L1-like esterase